MLRKSLLTGTAAFVILTVSIAARAASASLQASSGSSLLQTAIETPQGAAQGCRFKFSGSFLHRPDHPCPPARVRTIGRGNCWPKL